jgi:Tfp pilus assembly PilM family ATPase
MNSLNIDFRDNCLRILKITDDRVVSAKLLQDLSINETASAKNALLTAINESGGKNNRINLILPQAIVRYSVRHVPLASDDDLPIILRRMIAKEQGDDSFTFGFREITEHKKSRPGTKLVLVEYVRSNDTAGYITLLNECGIKPYIITSGLEGNLHLLKMLRPKTEGNEAIIDIGAGSIEAAIINNGRLIDYNKLQLVTDFSEDTEGDENSSKIKIYKIIDLLYKVITPYVKASESEGLSRIWLCGIGSALNGITGSISSGFGVAVDLLNGFESQNTNVSAFSALAGVSLSSAKDITCFLPAKITEAKKIIVKKAVIAASLAVYISLLFFTYFVKERSEKELRAFLENKKLAITAETSGTEREESVYFKDRNRFLAIISASPSLYPALRDVANLTTPGVRLQQITIERKKDATILTIEAEVRHSDEVYKDSLFTKYLSGLDASKTFKSISASSISTSGAFKEEGIVSVRSSYEVLK